ncbi:amidase signature domain-containing protein [Aspergillus bertholletiae]|uniref:Amidase signature domain-containing protein n=1 Tax=Aspergillus bertholletiae TaxID=1226010 RepID=A0A5N7AN89_9EURO|nr:amidase signature domain-containing protein [Aspergillus bertholletiae]
MTELYHLTGTQARDRIRDGKVTVEEYARSLLTRIQERDPLIHAWAYLNPERVIQQAKALDQISPENRGPLHGIAIGIKDVVLTKDMPTGYNSAIYKDAPSANVDAAAVLTLRAAGALIVGKTATTEFAASSEGGPCTNPHSPEHTPGGSSSGSGAAVADFQIPIALGTQTGGSMIRPGSFNAVYAFKPTWNAISRDGVSHFSVTCDTVGFFTRSVADLDLLASVFDLADDIPIPRSPFAVDKAKIAVAKTHVWPKAGPGLQAAWERAQALLVSHGAEVEEIELPENFSKLKEWHETILAGEGRASFRGNYLLSKDKLAPRVVGYVENKPSVSRRSLLDSYDGCAQLRPLWDNIVRQYDAVIVPSTVDEAPLGLAYTGDSSFCSMWTLLHAPCLNVPGFVGEKGLPLGLTIVGARYHDVHVLRAGKEIGAIFSSEGGFVSQIQ